MMFRAKALVSLAFMLNIACASAVYADQLDAQIDDVLSSGKCPSPLVKLSELDLRASCGPLPYEYNQAYDNCQTKVLRFNLRVEKYNDFLFKCRDLDDKTKEAIRKKAPDVAKRPTNKSDAPTLAERLAREKSNASATMQTQKQFIDKAHREQHKDIARANAEIMRRSQKEFIDRAYNEQRTAIEKHQKEEADRRAQEQQAKLAAAQTAKMHCNYGLDVDSREACWGNCVTFHGSSFRRVNGGPHTIDLCDSCYHDSYSVCWREQ